MGVGLWTGYVLDVPGSIPTVLDFSLFHNVQTASGYERQHFNIIAVIISIFDQVEFNNN
jgi:hypothetical protein